MLEERNHGGSHGDHLTRGNIEVVDLIGADGLDVTTLLTNRQSLLNEVAVLVDRGVGLRDDVAVFLISGEVVDLVGDDTIADATVRSLNETERVHACVAGQRTNQTNVRTLWGLNWTHATVVGRVNVSNLKASTVTGQTTRAQCGQTTLVGQTRQRVVLVHELGQLGSTEELTDSRGNRAHVNQGGRLDRLHVLSGHALTNHAFHAGQTHADLVLNQLAYGTQTTVTEVVDIVGLNRDFDTFRRGHNILAVVQAHKVFDGGSNILLGQNHLAGGISAQTQLAVDLVATDLSQVVALRLEEVVLQQSQRGLARRRLTRALLAVNLQQSLVGVCNTVLLQGGHHDLREAEALLDLLGGPAESLQQNRDRLATLTVNTNADGVPLVDVELQPRTARRNNLHRVQRALGGLVDGLIEVDARRAHQLRNNDTLSSVDDERTLVRHHREVTDEDSLALDLTGLAVGELRGDVEGSRVVDVLILGLIHGVLNGVEPWVRQRQGHLLGVVLDRRELF